MRTKATKKIMGVGHSLTVNVTKEVKAMGLDRGDYVNITLEPVDDQPQEGGKGRCIDCIHYEKKVWDLGHCPWCNHPELEGEILYDGPIDYVKYCKHYVPKTDD